MTGLRAVATLVAKDLRVEVRSRQTVGLLVVLAVLIVAILAVGVPAAAGSGAGGATVIWVAYLFSGVLCFERSVRIEQEDDALAGLMMAPIARGAIYAAKFFSNLTMLLALTLVLVPAGAAFFRLDLGADPVWLACILGLSLIGLAAVGTLFSAASIWTRSSGGVIPLLVFPLALPLVIASTREAAALSHGGSSHAGLLILIAFDVLFLAAGWLAFETLLDP